MSKPPANHDVAARLREARQRIFRSAAAAAEAMGLKAGTVRAHENGQNGVSLFDLEQYARRYGVTIDWLITGKGVMDPDALSHAASGLNVYGIGGLLRDGSWVEAGEDDLDTAYPGWGGAQMTPAGIEEEVEYADARFPPEMINVLRVRTDLKEGPYVDGTLVFGVSVEYLEYRDGDHLIVVREKGSFYEWSLRRVVFEDDRTILEPLISNTAPLIWNHQDPRPEDVNILGVVVGSLTKRPVTGLTPAARRRFERDWMAFIKDA